jgi:hypothetical protein
MKEWKASIGFWNNATTLGGGDVESLFSFVCTFRIIKQGSETSGFAEVEVRRNDMMCLGDWDTFVHIRSTIITVIGFVFTLSRSRICKFSNMD